MSDNQTVEQLFDELKRICDTLEKGKLGLDASVALFARGLEVEARIQSVLSSAERRVVEIIEPDGTIKPFEIPPKR